jgi:predicted nucleic acid-binding protein
VATYLLDTGIVLGFVRGAAYAAYTERKYSVNQPPNVSLLSVVSRGELYSLAIQLGWGIQKRQSLEHLLLQIPQVDINKDPIIQRYAEIDAYSQGKDLTQRLPQGLTSRNMGKNDLWIAATASVLNASLLTIDKDFDHLNGQFLDVIYIDRNLKPSDLQ